MRPEDIVEAIMAMHWDLAECPCWICVNGRESGLHVWERWLPHRMAERLPAVHVEPPS